MIYFDEYNRIEKEKWIKKYPQFIQKIFYNTKNIFDYYDGEVSPLVKKGAVILDAGCGKKGIMNKYIGNGAVIVGSDLEIAAIKRNEAMQYKTLSSLDSLCFKDETFDLIVSQWVVEHLPEPERVFREFNRVLKKGGSLILVTNSIYNPLMTFNAIMPQKLRDNIKKRVLPPEIEEDTFPTYYRANSIGRLNNIMAAIGFKKCFSVYTSDTSFFIFSKWLFYFSLLFEHITDIPLLRPLRMHIVAHYRK
ncbi:MAG: methyltransferase domain-containing protein [Nitrospirota bacterium]